jgi:AcrR family transcriptional regulator
MAMAIGSNPMLERILQAARACFSRYGVHRTSMTDVAKARRGLLAG